MVCGDVTFQYLDILALGDFYDEFPGTQCAPGGEDWFTILGNPDDMIFEVIQRMGSFSIVLHRNMIHLKRIASRRGCCSQRGT